ncbi:MAG: PKD domain-containing protein [Caldiserica bacterium]|nr:PKD domain-containing protein [Caldisericota bacterium]
MPGVRATLRRIVVALAALGVLAILWGCSLRVSDEGIVAVIRAEPTEGHGPLEVVFDASASRDPAGSISEYLWDFGDGTEVASGVRVTHVYRRPGSYLVTLVVTGPSGVGRATTWIYVDNSPPVADFSFWPEDPMRKETVEFDASSSYDPDGEVVGYYWDFGDGTTAEGPQVAHAYAEDGEYAVSLTVVDDSGAEAMVTKTVVVETCQSGPPGTCPLGG